MAKTWRVDVSLALDVLGAHNSPHCVIESATLHGGFFVSAIQALFVAGLPRLPHHFAGDALPVRLGVPTIKPTKEKSHGRGSAQVR